MSAFMVSPEHIRLLVTAEARLGHVARAIPLSVGPAADRAAILTRHLTEACAASVAARYPATVGAVVAADTTYTFRGAAPWPLNGERDAVVLATIIQLCRCYDHQACEARSWSTSTAKTIIDATAGEAQRRLVNLLAPNIWHADSADLFMREPAR